MANSFITQTNLKRDQNRFFLGTIELPGVQSVQGEYTNNFIPLNFIGCANFVSVPNGAQTTQLSVSTLVIDNDHFFQYTGASGVNLYILQNRGSTGLNFSFSSGYMTSFNSRATIGEIPQNNAGFTIFGNAGQFALSESTAVSGDLATISAGSPSFNLQITDPGAISLTLNEYNTNRVLSYDLSLSIPRNAIYPLGSRVPNSVIINYPIVVELGFQVVLNNYSFHTLNDFPGKLPSQNISINLKTFDTNASVLNFAFNDMFLLKEGYSVGVDGNVVADLRYRAYLSRPSGA